ncbi:MAG TPA: hypothetical protein ENK57_24900 [Polyangiaceae bacterium]|nr:hypothetical protein [Polyangiaceae bacterium]
MTDASAYDTVADEWSTLPSLPSPRDHLVGGVFYAIGGSPTIKPSSSGDGPVPRRGATLSIVGHAERPLSRATPRSDDAPASTPEDRGYARSLRQPPRTWLELVEASAAWCAAGGFVAAIGVMLGYVHRHAAWLTAEGWWRLAIQAITFAVLTGAGCGAGIAGAVFAFDRRQGRWWHVLGGFGAVPAAAVAGAFAAEHFGTKSLPYLGVGPIFAAVALGVAVSGTGFARTAQRSIRWRRAVLHALWPSGVLALSFSAVTTLVPRDVNVELDVMRSLASSLGLGTLGAIGGTFTGAVGGLALATTLVAARRWP